MRSRKRSAKLATIILWLASCPAAPTVDTALADNSQVSLAISAIQDRICFEEFWWGKDFYHLGSSVPIFVRQAGDVTLAWSDKLSAIPGAKQWANFFRVAQMNHVATVDEAYGYNLDLLKTTPKIAKDKEDVFSERTVKKIEFHVPANCTPHFRANTLQKKETINHLKSAIVDELTQLDRFGRTAQSGRSDIVIANFNADYPETLVLVPSTGEIFRVALHGPMFVGPLLGSPEYLAASRKRILKYGMTEQVTIPK